MVKHFDAVVIGDANVDLAVVGANEIPLPGQEVYVDEVMLNVGGGAAIFSLALAKLGQRVAFNGVLGDDLYGRYVREHFAKYGIDTRMIKTSKIHQTGISIAFNPDQDRSFITYAGTNTELRMNELDYEQIAQGRHAHITGYKGKSNHEAYIQMAKELKARGMTISCDVGWDDTGEWYKGIFEFMSHVDVFLMNETEALHYTGLEDINESLRFMSQYCGNVVIKLGAQGSAAIKDGVITHQAAFRVESIDTTGAGDCFNAGYLSGFLTEQDVQNSLILGNACGAKSVSAYGGSTGLIDGADLQQFIARQQADKGADQVCNSQAQ
ncbi:carbohydrate kinase family protein [Paenibacillus sp. NPDC058071]|uniref:carbohydrate kinase family protein n=1 Tax=Paenibacillus sp. NPDC058071 TaxID=3346326 RepID=UPI0036D97C13